MCELASADRPPNIGRSALLLPGTRHALINDIVKWYRLAMRWSVIPRWKSLELNMLGQYVILKPAGCTGKTGLVHS